MVENTPYAVGSEYFWIKKYVVAIVLNEQIKSVKVNELSRCMYIVFVL